MSNAGKTREKPIIKVQSSVALPGNASEKIRIKIKHTTNVNTDINSHLMYNGFCLNIKYPFNLKIGILLPHITKMESIFEIKFIKLLRRELISA